MQKKLEKTFQNISKSTSIISQKAPLGIVGQIFDFDFLVSRASFSESDGKLKIHTCCLGGVNIAEAVKAKVAKIKIVAFILASEFKLRTNYQLFAYILSFYLNNKGRGSMFIIVYGHTHNCRPTIFFTRIIYVIRMIEVCVTIMCQNDELGWLFIY